MVQQFCTGFDIFRQWQMWKFVRKGGHIMKINNCGMLRATQNLNVNYSFIYFLLKLGSFYLNPLNCFIKIHWNGHLTQYWGPLMWNGYLTWKWWPVVWQNCKIRTKMRSFSLQKSFMSHSGNLTILINIIDKWPWIYHIHH